MLEKRLSRPVRWHYVDTNRREDHICYISDLTKLKAHYPGWRITRTLDDTIDEILQAEAAKQTV